MHHHLNMEIFTQDARAMGSQMQDGDQNDAEQSEEYYLVGNSILLSLPSIHDLARITRLTTNIGGLFLC